MTMVIWTTYFTPSSCLDSGTGWGDCDGDDDDDYHGDDDDDDDVMMPWWWFWEQHVLHHHHARALENCWGGYYWWWCHHDDGYGYASYDENSAYDIIIMLGCWNGEVVLQMMIMMVNAGYDDSLSKYTYNTHHRHAGTVLRWLYTVQMVILMVMIMMMIRTLIIEKYVGGRALRWKFWWWSWYWWLSLSVIFDILMKMLITSI